MLRVLPDFERFLKVHNLHNAAVPLVTLAGDPVVHLVPIPVIETRDNNGGNSTDSSIMLFPICERIHPWTGDISSICNSAKPCKVTNYEHRIRTPAGSPTAGRNRLCVDIARDRMIEDRSPQMPPAARQRLRLSGGRELSFITAGEARIPKLFANVSGDRAPAIAGRLRDRARSTRLRPARKRQ